MLAEWHDYETHCHVLGAPRLGKSKFLEWCIRDLIEHNIPLCLIDWHGTLYKAVFEYLAYIRPSQPVILLNPAEQRFITPYTPFLKRLGETFTQVPWLVDAIVKTWDEKNTNEIPTFRRVAMAVSTFALVSGTSIQNSVRLLQFQNKRLRDYAIRILSQPEFTAARDTFTELQLTPISGWERKTVAPMNRIDKLNYQPVKRFMGLDTSIDLGKIWETNGILLVNLGGTLDRESAEVFATLLLNDFFREGMARVKNPSPFSLILDECQEYFGTHAAKMLDQVLKSGLRCTFAHHHMKQGRFLEDEHLRTSVKMGAAIKAVFGGNSAQEGKEIAEELFLDDVNQRDIKEIIETLGTEYIEEPYSTETQSESIRNGEDFIEGTSSASGTRFAPRQFKQRSQVIEWSREEKISRRAQTIIEQGRQSCILKLPGKKAEHFHVPFVEEYLQNPETILEYEQSVSEGSLSPEEADRRLADLETNFLANATKEHELSGPRKSPGSPKKAARKNIFG